MPNLISAKQTNIPTTDSSAVKTKQDDNKVLTGNFTIKYGDVDKGNRLYSAMENVKSSQGMAQEHVEAVNPQKNM